MAYFVRILRTGLVLIVTMGCMITYSSETSLSSQSFGPSTRLEFEKPALYYHFPEEDAAKIRHIFPYIVNKTTEHDVSLPFVLAIIKSESNFTVDAVSQAGALGLMQLMPNTAKAQYQKIVYGVQVNDLKKNLILHPELNVTLGIKYLRQLDNTLKGIENPDYRRQMVMAAYNAGLGRVKKSFQVRKTQTLVERINEKGDTYFKRSLRRLPLETRRYIHKVDKKYYQYQEYLRTVTSS
jgi:soluble lytic murein transglycosylase-like protein